MTGTAPRDQQGEALSGAGATGGGAADEEIAGALFGDRYRLGAPLRSTPLARVYQADDVHLARSMHVTVETGIDGPAADAVAGEPSGQTIESRLFAAAMQSALAVPVVAGLAVVHDVGVARRSGRTVRWMAAEPVAGVSADRYRGALPGAETVPDRQWELLVLGVAEQLAGILQRLHAAGIVHGALGPSTVLVDGRTPADLAVGVVDLGPRPGLLREHPTAAKEAGMLWRRWADALADPAPEVAAGGEPDERSDIHGFGRVIEVMLESVAVPELGWDELVHPSESFDLGLELRRLAEQASKDRPAQRQYSFLVVGQQLADIRSAFTAEQQEPGAGLRRLEATVAAEPPAELVAVLGWLSARIPDRWLNWMPGWRPLVARVGLPVLVAAARKRRRTGFAAYWAQRTRRTIRAVAIALCVIAVVVVGVGWAAASSSTQAGPVPISTVPLPSATSPGPRRTPSTDAASGVVPPLVGIDQDAAAAALARLGLHVGAVDTKDGPEPAGRILASSPAAGAALKAGAAVDLTVASGNQTVPEGLVGHGQQEVTGALRAAGFTVAVVTVDTSSYVTGYVLDVNPEPGTAAPVGSAITVTVARYGTSPTLTPSPTPGPSRTPSG